MLIIHMTIIILVLVTWCTLCLVIEAEIAKLLNIKITAKCTVYMVFSCYAIHALLNRLIMLIKFHVTYFIPYRILAGLLC